MPRLDLEHRARMLSYTLVERGFQVSRHAWSMMVFKEMLVATIHLYPWEGRGVIRIYRLNPRARMYATVIERLVRDIIPGLRVEVVESDTV